MAERHGYRMEEASQIVDHWLELLMKLVDIECAPHFVNAYLSGIRAKKLFDFIASFVSMYTLRIYV